MSVEMVTNELGQKVRVIEWDDLVRRVKSRKMYTGVEDLNDKILVVKHTWGIGDILYSTPALKGLKEKFPRVKIIYICSFPEVLEGNPYVDEVHHHMQFNDIFDISDRLKEEDWYFLNYDTPLKGGYDYKIHLRTKYVLNEYLMSLLKRDSKTLHPREKEFYDQASNAAIGRYRMIALDLYCQHAYIMDDSPKSVYYYPTPEESNFARLFMSSFRFSGKKVVVLIPNTSTRFKDYPHWKEVMKILPKNLFWLLLGRNTGKGEKWIGDNMLECFGSFSLRQSFALCMEADMACSSDTGIMYPRLALGKPAVMLYGPHEAQPFLHHFPSARGLRIDRLKSTPGMEGMCSVGCYIDAVGCKSQDGYSPCLAELAPEVVARNILEVIQ